MTKYILKKFEINKKVTRDSSINPIYMLGKSRVVYDRVRKRKNYFEIAAFLQIEGGKSRARKFKTSNENKTVFAFI